MVVWDDVDVVVVRHLHTQMYSSYIDVFCWDARMREYVMCTCRERVYNSVVIMCWGQLRMPALLCKLGAGGGALAQQV